ncbi:MAG: RHS repeat-associated core domain-containing protein [Thermoanaerobaculia bacterium]
MPDPDESHVWLITRFGTYVEFWNLQGGLYTSLSPSDEYRQLHRTASGWELRGLDGTVQSFDETGRWSGTVDRNGNARIPSYDGEGRLEEVALPDGRTERFGYHPDGKLASITEVGIDGVTARTWTYTWAGDDLRRVDQPGGTVLEFSYNDPRYSGYLTRVERLGSGGGPPRVEQGWQYDDHGNVMRFWKGETTSGAEGDEPGPGAVQVWSYAFDNSELPTETEVTDPLGNVSTYSIDRDPVSETPRVVSISGDCPTCGLGPNTQFYYDDPVNPLQPTRTVDGRGTTTLTAYDTNGQMTSRTEALGTPLERTTTWEYGEPAYPAFPTANEQPSTSGSGVRRTETVYDAQGNAKTRTITGVEAGSSFSYQTVTDYNSAGQPETIDPPGYGTEDRTSFTYDPARGNLLPLTRTNLLVGTTGFGYDPLNRRTQVTDANGVVTETVYDELDRVRLVIQKGATLAEDLVTEHIYNGVGDLFRTILPEGNVLEYGYDSSGRLRSIERKPNMVTPGERTLYQIDPAGNRNREELQWWDGSGWVTESFTEYVYTSRCQLDKILHPDGTVTEYGYDCDGNLKRVWDANHPSGNQTAPATQSYGYDELDRLTTLAQPWTGEGGGEAETRYAYDVQDHLIRVTDAEGNVTQYVYSDRDLLTEEISEVSGTSTYRYNEHGQLEEETDARGISVTRLLDPLDRVVFVDYPDNSLDVTYTYDDPAAPFSKGRLTSITRAGQSVDYGYDRFGRVTRDGDLTYDYDDNGNRTLIGYPGGVEVTYTHDFADRQESLTLQDGGNPSQPVVTGAAYKPSGPLSVLDLGNGVTEIRDFDQHYFPQRIQVGGLLDWTYTTDAVGNILSITDAENPTGTRSYDYQDVQYFLTVGNGPWGELFWTYDKIGNRLTENRDGETEVYQYLPNSAGGRNPKLSEINPGTEESIRYFYDAAGNQTYRAEGATKQRFSYDSASRLSQILTDSPESAGAMTQFRYDGRSFLATATLTPFPGRPEQLTSSATYSSEGLLHHKATDEPRGPRSPRNAPDRVTDSFVLTFAGRPVGIYDRVEETALDGQVSEATSLTYLTTDHLGTPVLATNAGGNSAWSGGFEPFGADYSEAQQAGVFLRFPGQWENEVWEAASEGEALYYNVHRWYEYGTGRYSRPDPLGRKSTPNLFGYADTRPTRVIDPLGLVWLAVPPYGNEKDFTIECRAGRVVPRWGEFNSDLERKCCAICVFAHELSHARDAERENPNVCEGVRDGWLIKNDAPAMRRATERRAYRKMLECLQTLRARPTAKGCEDTLDWWIFNVEKTLESDVFP